MLEVPASLKVASAAPSTQTRRRALFFTLVALSIAGLLWLLVDALSAGGFGLIDGVLVMLFAVTLPWFAIGFWNGTIGLLIMRFARDPVAAVTPAAARASVADPITASTAILLCTRNEPPGRVIGHLLPLMEGLATRGVAGRFHVYALSDTDSAAIAATEDTQFAALAEIWRGRLAITYRRRETNTAFKAGNIHDFCRRWGKDHDFALVLDADSVMTADAVTRLVRVMQADPRLGILQSLVTGLPSTSAFARIFQFGMRLGMRSYTIGSAWWQGDCGPYWGHNALIRLAPFMAHCPLPQLPGGRLTGGHVLSHDQVEAVLMRRAGFEVRVLPEEGESFEQNPPTLIEFIRRDLRWCQGNMQYWHFLVMPGLKPISRYQLAFAILMFIGSPAWIGLLVIGSLAAAAADAPAQFIKPGPGAVLLALLLVMWFAPKLATIIDVLTRPRLRGAFGGALRFTAGALIETVFFVLLAPIMWFSHTIFLVRLLAGRAVGWGVQARDDHAVPLRVALSQLWPHTLLGAGTVGVLALTVPAAIPYALFIAGGPLVSIPLAIFTASPSLGRLMLRVGLGRLPEETAPPPELRALALKAIEPTPSSAVDMRATWRTARGVLRSLRIYYGDRARRTAMDRLYAEFIRPGDLAFDVGAHVGDRIASLRRLGARVVAVEPQPAVVATLKLLYGRDRAVAIEPLAVGRGDGTIELRLNVDNPTVSTASAEFVHAADGAPGWEDQAWSKIIRVPVTTLDALIARHGAPAFIKIDVEGFEAEVLAALTRPAPALSFEFTTIQRAVAEACLERCATLGYALFNAALGESQTFAHARWQSAAEMAHWLAALPDGANSGDIYARLP